MMTPYDAHPSRSLFWKVLAVAAIGCLLLPPFGFCAQPASRETTATDAASTGAVKSGPHAAAEHAAERQALGFVQYLDQGRYTASYAYTSRLLRAKLGRSEFAREVRQAREQAGREESRELLNASYTTDLKGQPVGQYVVLQYGTKFTKKTDAVETLVMSFENGYWRVAGWFIK